MEPTPHLRPQAHFTPARTWMNDPNGLVHVDGTFHLFFQTNPDGVDWGSMSWGHATAPDLVTWTEHPLALRHTGTEAIFSGSVVVDHHNTSGLGKDGRAPLVAVYTSHYEDGSPRAGTQAQSLAWSTDGGQTWTTHPQNPVLDRGSSDFRDPKVFWHEPDRCWVMVAVEALERQVVVYRSPDLHRWEPASTFGPSGSTEGIWECPDLFELPVSGTGATAWVLVVSVGDGGPAGGSGTQWFVGDFDGRRFTPHDEVVRWLDRGPDHYAAVSFDNVPDRRLMIGWASNWAYAAEVPTSPWRGCMSLAREVDLVTTGDGLRVRQRPVLPIDAPVLRHVGAVPVGARHTLTFTTEAGTDPLTITVDTVEAQVLLDRSRCGAASMGPSFPARITAPLPPRPQGNRAGDVGCDDVDVLAARDDVDVLVVVDGCVVEVYVDGGLMTLTALVLPSAELRRVTTTRA